MDGMLDRKVPSEMLGKARVFVDKVHHGTDGMARLRYDVAMQIRDRLRKKRTLREDRMLRWQREWYKAKGFGQQAVPEWIKDAETGDLVLRDLLLVKTKSWDHEWLRGEDEPGVNLCEVAIKIAFPALELTCKPMINFSLHALGRFFQRSFTATEDALIDSIWSSPDHCTELAIGERLAGEEFSLALRDDSGGAWHGRLMWMSVEVMAEPQPIRFPSLTYWVRSFYTA